MYSKKAINKAILDQTKLCNYLVPSPRMLPEGHSPECQRMEMKERRLKSEPAKAKINRRISGMLVPRDKASLFRKSHGYLTPTELESWQRKFSVPEETVPCLRARREAWKQDQKDFMMAVDGAEDTEAVGPEFDLSNYILWQDQEQTRPMLSQSATCRMLTDTLKLIRSGGGGMLQSDFLQIDGGAFEVVPSPVRHNKAVEEIDDDDVVIIEPTDDNLAFGAKEVEAAESEDEEWPSFLNEDEAGDRRCLIAVRDPPTDSQVKLKLPPPGSIRGFDFRAAWEKLCLESGCRQRPQHPNMKLFGNFTLPVSPEVHQKCTTKGLTGITPPPPPPVGRGEEEASIDVIVSPPSSPVYFSQHTKVRKTSTPAATTASSASKRPRIGSSCRKERIPFEEDCALLLDDSSFDIVENSYRDETAPGTIGKLEVAQIPPPPRDGVENPLLARQNLYTATQLASMLNGSAEIGNPETAAHKKSTQDVFGGCSEDDEEVFLLALEQAESGGSKKKEEEEEEKVEFKRPNSTPLHIHTPGGGGREGKFAAATTNTFNSCVSEKGAPREGYHSASSSSLGVSPNQVYTLSFFLNGLSSCRVEIHGLEFPPFLASRNLLLPLRALFSRIRSGGGGGRMRC